jgi:hypothetical protein
MPFPSLSSQYVMPISPYIALGGDQVLLGLLALTRPPIEPAEVAVGHERAHPELGDQGHRGTVVGRGRPPAGWA